jgi:hypothetical protein
MAAPETLTLTIFDAVMKEIYPNVRVEGEAMRKAEFFRWVPKRDEFYGDTYVVPILFENPQGHSRVFANALQQVETTRQRKFVATSRKKDYGIVKIDAETMMASSKEVGAFIKARETQINTMLNQLGKRTNLALFRKSAGHIGQVATTYVPASTTIPLTRKADVYNFGLGQTILADDTESGASPRVGTPQITALSASAGTITVSAAPAALAAGDFLFNNGDQSASFNGLEGWLPLTAPTAGDNFLGVDRSEYVERLAGKRVDSAARTILENATELATLIAEDGGDPDTLWLHPRAGKILAEELQGQVERLDGGAAEMGFSGYKILHFATGPINVLFDRDCQADRGYMLTQKTWRFAHMGPVPHLVRDDTLTARVETNADAIQVRARLFGDLFCEAPGWNGVMSVATF